MRYLTRIAVFAIVATLCCGCFKDEKQGTRMLVALWSQNVVDDPILPTTADCEGYAFKVEKGSKWEVASWEDAIAHRITNTDTGEQKAEEQIYVYATYDTASEYQMGFELWTEHTFLVVVDKSNKLYATRQYDTPMNLPVVYTDLHLYAYKKSGTANGWIFTNPFPDEKREPLVPKEEEEVVE